MATLAAVRGNHQISPQDRDGPRMTAALLDVSAIICAYTEARWDDIQAAIDSLQEQTRPPHEIVVVVDHNPRLLERLRGYRSDIVVVENAEARVLSGARNSGIAAAHGVLIAFLDDDAVAAPDWLERLYTHCLDPQVLGAGGFVEPAWVADKPAWFPAEFGWVVGCSYRGLPRAIEPVRNLFGGCSLIRREVFDAVGGFRTGVGREGTLPAGCEETELSIRAHQRWPQRIFLYDPEATIRHRVPTNRATWRYFYARCYGEGRSKALVAQLVGAGDGLSSERTYTLRVLPQGVLRGITDSLVKRDPAGILRAGAIVTGLTLTTVGYLTGTVSQRVTPWKRS